MHPAIRMTRHVCDDEIDTARFGTEIGTDFTCGDGIHKTLVYVPDEPDQPVGLYFYDLNCLSIPEMDAARILLTDPTVQAAIAQKQANQGLPPTVQITRQGYTDTNGSAASWTDYTIGTATISVPDGGMEPGNPATLILGGREMGDYPTTLVSLQALIGDLQTLISDPGVCAAIERAQLPQRHGCPVCGGDLVLNLKTLHYHCTQESCSWHGFRPALHRLAPAEHLVIASLDDAPVLARRYIDDETAQALLGWFTIEWQGETIGTGGDQAISMPDAETGIADNLHEKHFTWLKAAATADLFPRFLAIAQRYRDQPWPTRADQVLQRAA